MIVRFGNILLCGMAVAALPSVALAQSTEQATKHQTDANVPDPGAWRLSTGVNYSEGDYGDIRKTKVISAPLALKYSRGGFNIKVSVPYVHIDGAGSLLDTPQGRDAGFGDDAAGFDDKGGLNSGSSGSSGGSGSGSSGSGSSGSGSGGSGSGGSGGSDDSSTSSGTTVTAPVAGGTTAPSTRRSGIGDVSVTLGYSLEFGDGFYADVSGRVKLPTASKAKRLGTGKVDFTGGVDLVKDIGQASVYLGGRRKFIGKPSGSQLRDIWGFGTGASYRLTQGLIVGADYDWQQSSTTGNGPSSEITGWANFGLTKTVRMQVFSSTGFTNNSADFSGGLSLSWRFR